MNSISGTKKVLSLVIITAVILLLGFVNPLVFTPINMEWYDALNKSKLTPPSFLFAYVWLFLYIVQAIAVWLIYISEKVEPRTKAINLFIAQMGLNVIWSYLFFEMKSVGPSLIDILIMDVLVVICIVLFWKINKIAAALLFPYIGWLSLATYLNFYILINN